jgi:PleD family two-component response regulator
MMPHLDGMSATAQIRQFDRRTPIVSVTANVTQDARTVYMSCGMNDVLPKPFNRDTMLNVVEKYCVHLLRTQTATSAHLTMHVPRPLATAGVIEEFDDTNNNNNNNTAVALIGHGSNSEHNISLSNPTAMAMLSNSVAHSSEMYNNPLSAMMFGVAQQMTNWNETALALHGMDSTAGRMANAGLKRSFIELTADPTMVSGTTTNNDIVYNNNMDAIKRARVVDIL